MVIHVDKKIKLSILVILIAVFGLSIFEIANGTIENDAFDVITYNYTAYVSIPNDTPDGPSLGGVYNIQGMGNKFKFNVMLPGTEEADDPLEYAQGGLNGNGSIDSINVTFDTINDLLNQNFKKAMFETPVSGHFAMSCAAWTGYGNFSNNGTNFPGYFQIIGPDTYWKGTFNLVQESNRIAVVANYIYHPNTSNGNVTHVSKTYYM